MKTITIVTCDRKPSYLEKTVSTIPLDYHIQYLCQGEVELPKSGDMIPVDKKYQKDRSRHRDAQYNYSQALLNTKDGLIIEDDVILSENFDEHLNMIKSKITDERYAIALYSCYSWYNPRKQLILASYPLNKFYGFQAMLYDVETARDFGKYLLDNIGKEPHDIALATYIKKVSPQTKLYATSYSLVQHIGDITTGLGAKHKTFNFIDNKANSTIFKLYK